MRARLHKPKSDNTSSNQSLFRRKVMPKLVKNKPGDLHEQEADRAADEVVKKSSSGNSLSPAGTGVVQAKPLSQTLTPRVQLKEEEDVQTKEDENVQLKEPEMSKAGMADPIEEEDPIRAQEIQTKEEDIQAKEEEGVQLNEDESVQAKEDENVQLNESEDVQAKEDENVQLNELEEVQAKEEDVQTKEEEGVQLNEDESVQAKEEEDVQLNESEDIQAKEDENVQLNESEEVQSKEEDVQTKEEEGVQAKEFVGSSDNSVSDNSLQSTKGGGSSLPSDTLAEMNSGFGADFSGVKIHTGAQAEEMSGSLGAQAFTHQNDIYFNSNKFNPSTTSGKFLLAHELAHTVQQGATPVKETQQEPEQSTSGSATTVTETNNPKQKEQSVEAIINAPATETEQEKEEGSENAVKPTSGQSKPGAGTSAENPVKAISTGQKSNLTAPEAEASAEEEEAEGEQQEAEVTGPENDPNFLAVTENIGVVAEEEQEHDPAGELSDEAQDAALSPSNERKSIAQAGQVEEMEEAEPQPFSVAAFKEKLMAKIADMQLPENQEEAAEFDKNNNIDQVNQSAVGDVNTEKSAAAGPVEQATDKQPDTAGVKERKVTPMKPQQPGAKPQGVGAANAIPPKRSDESVQQPLQDETAKMDQKMAENNVTDTQLEKSEEPSFQQALDSKKEAKTDAETAPQGFRQQEDTTLQGASQQSEAASQKQLAGMHQMRGSAFQKVTGNQKNTAKKDTSEREKIANDINGIYESTKTEVNTILDSLEDKVGKRFDYFAKIAKKAFEDYVAMKMLIYKARRYSGLAGAARWTKDLFMGLPDEVNQFFVEGKEVFVRKMDEGITNIANLVANELNRAKKRIEQGQKDVTDYVESLPKNLRHLGKEAAKDIQDKFAALQEDVNSREESLIDTLAQSYMGALEEVNERIEEMKAANKGLVDAAMGFINGVIETIMKLKEMIVNLFAAIQSVIGVIMEDPIGFMKNLFDGIGKGIDAFKANIQQHLMGGLIEWLTGSLGPIGITIPEDIFSLKGIFSLVMQVLGLSWDYIRQKAVLMMGEPVVKALEGGFNMFKIFATKGIEGIWEFLKDSFTDLKETVIEAIKGMLITQVIQAGIKWLMSLLIPGAGFIKAIMAIKDLIVFFVESAIMLIPAITEAILALAAGSVVGVAKAIEFGLSKLIALVINLFAKLIGLGGLSKKVMAIFSKIRKRVDKAVMKLLNKAKKAGRKLLSKLGIGAKEKPKNKQQHDEQVKAGLQYIDQISNKEDKDKNNALTEEEAQQVAAKTKKKFAVFTSIKPRKEGGKWVYDWKGSEGTKKTKDEVEGDDAPVKGFLMNESSIKKKDHLSITESRQGKQVVGFKAKEKGSKAVFDGFIVGQDVNNYIRNRNQKDDVGSEFKTLSNKKNPDDRREHIKGSGATQSLEEKLKVYESVLKKAGITLKPPTELTDSTVDQFRRDMIVKVAAAYPKKLDKLDSEILHGELTGKVGNKILGEIFEKWVALNVSDVGGIEVVFNNGGVIRRADAEAGNSLVEMKSISSGPNTEHKGQMKFYNYLLLSGEKGYLAGSKGQKKVGPFTRIRYYFSNNAAARLWEKLLVNTFGNKVTIYVGTEKYISSNTDFGKNIDDI